MSSGIAGVHPVVGSRTPPVRSLWLFTGVALVNLLAAVYLNTGVLTDDVYRSIWAGLGSGPQIEALLALTRRWEVVGYLVGPLSLFARVGLSALLVQLALLLLGPRSPLAHVFRAGIWAQIPLVLGTLAQLCWLSLLPPAARSYDTLQALPVTALGLVSRVMDVDPAWQVLLGRLTIFDLGWVVFFALALEDRGRISTAIATTAVTGVWLLMTVTQWSAWLYLTRI